MLQTLAAVEGTYAEMPKKVTAHMAVDPTALGNKLRGAMADEGYTAQRLAAEMRREYGDAAPSAATLNRYANGETQLTVDTFMTAMLIMRSPRPQERLLHTLKRAADREVWKMLISW